MRQVQLSRMVLIVLTVVPVRVGSVYSFASTEGKCPVRVLRRRIWLVLFYSFILGQGRMCCNRFCQAPDANTVFELTVIVLGFLL